MVLKMAALDSIKIIGLPPCTPALISGGKVDGVSPEVHKEMFGSKSLAVWLAAGHLDATTVLGSP